MSFELNKYEKKYLKYKNKYLQLKYDLVGFGIVQAQKFFNKLLDKKPDLLKELYENDDYFKDLLDDNNILPINENSGYIFSMITNEIDNKLALNFIKLYLDKKMGEPNSLENKGRFIYNYEKLKTLRENRIPNLPNDFESLTSLENFINENQETLERIEEKRNKKKQKK